MRTWLCLYHGPLHAIEHNGTMVIPRSPQLLAQGVCRVVVELSVNTN